MKDAAERMALEELGHVSLLRAERRKAFHTERQGFARDGAVSLSLLAAMERRLADLIEQHPDCTAGGTEVAASLAAAARAAAAKLKSLPEAGLQVTATSLPADRSEDIAAVSEYLAEAYLRLTAASREGRVLGVALELAGVAVYRLGTLDPHSSRAADS